LGNPIAITLTAGQTHDLIPALGLLAEAAPEAVIADKAFDADTLIEPLRTAGITAVIPPKSTRKHPRGCDLVLYKERNLIERFFNKLKSFRGIATRYDKLARNFLAAVQLAAATILLN
jgi:transposase